MLESSFHYSSDDTDNDPNWDQNAENMSTSKLFYLQFNVLKSNLHMIFKCFE